MPTPLWLSLIPVVVVGLIVAWQCRPVPTARTRLFAWCYGVTMTPATLRLIGEYLAYQRRLRALLVGAAFVLPGLVTLALAGGTASGGAEVSTWWPLWMIPVATVWGEVSFARPAPAPGVARVAQLVPRRLADYLAPRWRRAPVAAGFAAVAAWASALLIPLVDSGADTPGGPDVALGIAFGLLVPLGVFGVGAYLVRRPQPVVSASLVAADDAVRAASLRTLATVGTTILLLDVVVGLVSWADAAQGPGDVLLAVGVVIALVLALLSWSAHNVWARPSRLAARPRPGSRRPSFAVPGPA